MNAIVLWSDYVSPYAFVAKAWAYELEADYDVPVLWRPYTLDIASFQGAVAERDPHHWRRVRYAYMDARRFANKQGLTLMGPKKIFYARPLNAGMLYAQRHGVFRPYNDLAFDRFWRRELDPETPQAVAALLVEAGAPAGFEDFLAGEGGAEHDQLRADDRPIPASQLRKRSTDDAHAIDDHAGMVAFECDAEQRNCFLPRRAQTQAMRSFGNWNALHHRRSTARLGRQLGPHTPVDGVTQLAAIGLLQIEQVELADRAATLARVAGANPRFCIAAAVDAKPEQTERLDAVVFTADGDLPRTGRA